MARVPIPIIEAVIGIFFLSPPIFLISCSWCIEWITAPAPRNKSALKNAWVTRWKIAATYAPAPIAININPSWEIVEYANTFLISNWFMAENAARSAVISPKTIMTKLAIFEYRNIGDIRTSINTPAVTIVAAWIRALAGVGPSMASGSQLKRGNWADLPKAPSNRKSDIDVMVDSATPLVFSKIL